MRVWKVNSDEWIAGPTLLTALRAAKRDLGRAAWEIIDRDEFAEVTDLDGIMCHDLETGRDMTLRQVAAECCAGVVMSTNY